MLGFSFHTLGVVILGSALVAQAPAPGLRLFQVVGSQPAQMVDTLGNLVHSWPGGGNVSSHLMPDGSLLRGAQTGYTFGVGGETGRLQQMAFDGTVLWDYLMNGPDRYVHHDIEPMPNGNVLVIAWDRMTPAQAVAAGRSNSLHTGPDWLPDSIVELQPTGPTTANIVWEWHVMDHIIQDFDPLLPNYGVVANHPELLDINYPFISLGDGDWNHANGLDYDPVNDWIAISFREQSEIYIIDHSTTTAEAAGHTGGARGMGGDILYRWGNPEAYGAGTPAERTLFFQHDPRFVAPGYPGAGNVTLFNNDYLPNESAAFELVLPLDAQGNFVLDQLTGRYGPVAPVWMFAAPSLYSRFVSSVERLPNGNTLICSGLQNGMLEVTPTNSVVWSYTHPNSTLIFHCHYVERSLWADATTLSVGGGQVGFDHLTGSTNAGDFFLLLGSVSGTSPGMLVPGGITMPLNPDYLTNAMTSSYNVGVFVHTIGTLTAVGGDHSGIVVPSGFIPPGLNGLHMDFAHMIFDNTLLVSRVSNPVGVTIVP